MKVREEKQDNPFIADQSIDLLRETKSELRYTEGQLRLRILVMDDDDVIRYLVGEMLSHLGYEFALAAEGFEAINMYKEAMDRNERFDAVIMDLTIAGGLGGRETINRLREMDPSIKAIVSSGYSNDPVMANFEEYGFSGVIAKPYKIADLSQALHKLLTTD